jgi:predicted transposase YdaD
MDFGYEVLRLWEWPVEALLAGGLATVPLAPLCRLPEGMSLEDGMRWVLSRVLERLDREGEPALVRRLLTATFVLCGLRLDRNQVRALFQGVRAMRESDTYQAILDEGRAEGRAEGAQRTLLHLGRKTLGEPDEAARHALLGITDLERLDRLSERLLEVSTWQELLQTP